MDHIRNRDLVVKVVFSNHARESLREIIMSLNEKQFVKFFDESIVYSPKIMRGSSK